MQFSSLFVGAATVALANAAAFTMGPAFFQVTYTAGSSAMNLTWDDASGPVTLLLKNGLVTNLQTVETIQTGLTGTSYSFTPQTTLANGQYVFEIDDSTGPNYSEAFTLTGGAASVSSSSAVSSTTGSTSTASSVSSSVTSSNSASTSASKTTSSASKSSTTSSTSTTSTTSTPNTNSASSFSSPLAFVFLALAAMVTIN